MRSLMEMARLKHSASSHFRISHIQPRKDQLNPQTRRKGVARGGLQKREEDLRSPLLLLPPSSELLALHRCAGPVALVAWIGIVPVPVTTWLVAHQRLAANTPFIWRRGEQAVRRRLLGDLNGRSH